MRPLVRHQRESPPAATVQDLDLDPASDLLACKHANEIVGAGHGESVKRQDDIAEHKTGPFGRASRLDRGDHHRAFLGQAGRMATAARQCELLGSDADIGATHAAMAHQFAQYETGRVRRDRKADALRAHDHRGVDADNLAVGGNQWAARIAGIERGVGLDDVIDEPPRARPE